MDTVAPALAAEAVSTVGVVPSGPSGRGVRVDLVPVPASVSVDPGSVPGPGGRGVGADRADGHGEATYARRSWPC